MNALFSTYATAFKAKGGGEVQLLKTREALEKLGGVKIDFFDGKQRLSDYALLHNFSIAGDCLETVKNAKKAGLKVAVSTIYWPQNEYALKERIPLHKKVKKIAYSFTANLGFSKAKEIISLADALLPNSQAEAEILRKEFGAEKGKIFVVPNGADEGFANAKPEEFWERFGFKDFVLYVGRIEPRKNVLALIKAAKLAGKELVIIGDAPEHTKDYYAECVKEAAGGKVHFLGRIGNESSLLASAYAACGVFALPSWYETPGLSALEAGLAGAKVVITDRGCTREYFGNNAFYANPADEKDIAEKIEKAFSAKKSSELKQRIQENFLWENAAEKTLEAYRKILGEQ
ncbi:MAG: glycosyltransferase [Candidatus Diapherotrites archaeon]